MTDLQEEFMRLGRKDERPVCQVAQALEKVKPAERDAVDQAVRSDDAQVRRGVRIWLTDQGIRVTPSAMTHHREKRCRCHD